MTPRLRAEVARVYLREAEAVEVRAWCTAPGERRERLEDEAMRLRGIAIALDSGAMEAA